jgi:hypothetical protein
VRGGTLAIGDLSRAAVKSTLMLGRPGISAVAAMAASPRELLQQTELPHPMVSFSSIGRVRNAGFRVEQTGKWPHHTIWLPDDWETSDALLRLKDAFDPLLVELCCD